MIRGRLKHQHKSAAGTDGSGQVVEIDPAEAEALAAAGSQV